MKSGSPSSDDLLPAATATEAGSDLAEAGLRAPLALLKHPLLALAPQRTAAIDYQGLEHGKPFRLHIRTEDPELGLATIEDLPVLCLITGALVARLNRGQDLHGPVYLEPAACLHALGRPTGGQQRKLWARSIQRLTATAITTDLAPGGQRRHAFFNLIEWTERPAPGRRGAWRVGPPSWLLEQVQARQFIKLDPALLQTGGLQRRVHAWCLAHAGGQGHETWPLRFDRAYLKSASTDAPRKFRHALRAIIAANAIPGFDLALEQRNDGEVLRVTRRAVRETRRTSQPIYRQPSTAETTVTVSADAVTPSLSWIDLDLPDDEPFALEKQELRLILPDEL